MTGLVRAERPGPVRTRVRAKLRRLGGQLTTRGVDFSLCALWALRDALEEEEPDPGLPALLPAAALRYLLAAAPPA